MGVMEPIYIEFDVPFDVDSVYTETSNINENSNILVYNSVFNDSSSSLRRSLSMNGTLEILSPSVLKFTPDNEFGLNQQVTVEVKDLYLADLSNFNSVSSNVLTTYDYLPVVGSTNIYDNKVPCNDTITVCFLGQYDDIYSLSDLVKVYQIDSTVVSNTLDTIPFQYADTTLLTISEKYFSEYPTITYKHEVSISVSYDSLTNCLTIVPTTTYESDALHILRVDIGDIVLGESSSNFRQTFFKKGESRVKIEAITQDTSNNIANTVLSNMGKMHWNLPVGDTVLLRVPDKIGDLQFWRWRSTDFPEIDSSNQNPFPFSSPCGTNINIYAEFIDPCLDTLSFVFDTNKIKLHTKGYSEQLDYNTFIFKKYLDVDFSFIALPIDSTVSVDSVFIDNSLVQIGFDIPFVISNNQDLLNPCDRENNGDGDEKEIVIGDIDDSFLATCTEMKFCIYIHKDDSESRFSFTQALGGVIDFDVSSYDIENITISNDEILACKIFKNVGANESRSWTFDLNISPSNTDKYEITYAYSSYNGLEIGTEYDQPAIGSSFSPIFTIQNETEKCDMALHVYIKPRTTKLYVDQYINDELLPAQTEIYLDIIKDEDDGKLFKSEVCRDVNGIQLIRYIYEYPFDTEAKHYPLIKNSENLYAYNKWVSSAPINDDYCIDENLSIPVYSTHTNYPYEDYLSVSMTQDRRIIYEYGKEDFYLQEIHLMLPSPKYKLDKDDGGSGFIGYNVSGNHNESLDQFSSDYLVGMKEDIRPYLTGLTTEDWYEQQNLPAPHRIFFHSQIPFIHPLPFLTDVQIKASEYVPSLERLAPITPIEYSLNFHRNTTKVRFLFSHPVNENSLEDNIIFRDLPDPRSKGIWGGPITRMDGYTCQYYKYSSGQYSNGNLLQNDRLVEMALVSKPLKRLSSNENYFRFSAVHSEFLNFHVLDGIKRDSDLKPLSNPQSNFRIETENPKLLVYLMDVYHNQETDECWSSTVPDIYAHIFSDIFTGNLRTKELNWEVSGNDAFKYGTFELPKESSQIPDSRKLLILSNNNLTSNDLVSVGFHIADEGGNTDASSKASDAGAKAGGSLLNKALEPAIKDIDNLYVQGLAAAGGGIIGAGLHFAISELMEHGIFVCDDKTLVKTTILGRELNMWSHDPYKTGLPYGRDYDGINNFNEYLGGYSFSNHDKGGITFFWILGDF